MNKGIVLLKICFISYCMNGENTIPRSPIASPGLTPKGAKFKLNRSSAQKTIQIINTNNKGYPIVPLVKTNGEDGFKLYSILINITKKHPNKSGC